MMDKRKIVRLAAAAGIVIFAFIIYKIGPRQILQHIKQLSPRNFFILVVLRILYWVLRTMSWKAVLDQYEGSPSLLNLFIARMGGHAVSQLTPMSQVGSETTRVFMAGCPNAKISVASVIIDKTIEYFSVVLFTIAGVLTLFFRISLPGDLQAFFVGVTLLSGLFVAFIIARQKKGLIGWLISLLARIKIRPKFLKRHSEKIKETDEHISSFYRNHPRAFLKVFLFYSLLMMFWVAEVHLSILFIGVGDISLVDSFLITSLGNLAFILSFIPGSLGVYEAAYVGIFALLGMGAAEGLTLVLVRRLIAMVLAGLGLLGMLKPSPQEKS
jgi:uncharacterized protein (TIRG00374 family)